MLRASQNMLHLLRGMLQHWQGHKASSKNLKYFRKRSSLAEFWHQFLKGWLELQRAPGNFLWRGFVGRGSTLNLYLSSRRVCLFQVHLSISITSPLMLFFFFPHQVSFISKRRGEASVWIWSVSSQQKYSTGWYTKILFLISIFHLLSVSVAAMCICWLVMLFSTENSCELLGGVLQITSFTCDFSPYCFVLWLSPLLLREGLAS